MAVGLVFLMVGDRAITAPVPGIDPLELLNLQVEPNVVIMLDSSGSMNNGAETNIETAGDFPPSKLKTAKTVLRAVIAANESRAAFQFGRYVQPAGTLVVGTNERFLYVSTNPLAATLQINPAAADASAIPGLRRATGDQLTEFGVTYYKLSAGRFWDAQTVRVDTAGAYCDPPGIVAGDPSPPGAFVIVEEYDACPGTTLQRSVTFTFVGAQNWEGADGLNSCGGFQSLVPLQNCGVSTELALIDNPYLQDELVKNADGSLADYVEGALGSQPTAQPRFAGSGIRAAGFTPIAESLIRFRIDHFEGNIWPNRVALQTPDSRKQKTIFIVVTDGDDTCVNATTASFDLDNLALRAAHKAEELFSEFVPGQSTSSVDTLLIGYGLDAGAFQRANWISWAGTGLGTPPNPDVPLTGSGEATQWVNDPALLASLRASCPRCRDAVFAQSPADLEDAIQGAIDRATTGFFSDSASVTDNIYEYGALSGISINLPPLTPVEPMNPRTRYGARVPVLLQTSFEMPDFKGAVKAFRNVSAVSTLLWNAVTSLDAQIVIATPSTFAQLTGSGGDTDLTTALVKRRIYTSTRNGVFPYGASAEPTAAQQPTALWPPTATVNPTDDSAGTFDARFGIAAMTFAQLQTNFRACLGTVPAGHPCLGVDPARVNRARREAREIILANFAGAQIKNNTGSGLPDRNAAGDILYEEKAQLLAESTLAVPAIITAPLESRPTEFTAEYVLFRDGPRNAAGTAVNRINDGFGMRNPDKDGVPASAADVNLKPVMSVVYYAANDMLHAFRAAACPAGPCAGEPGGRELWGFIPFDQLPRVTELFMKQPQTRNDHTYVMASSVRFSDVFVEARPGSPFVVEGRTYLGRWRTLLFVGRGIGGKSYTALDVTAPGPFTKKALETNRPLLVWSRGNPDTQDGIVGSLLHNYLTNDVAGGPSDVDLGATDLTAYAGMGQSWSVPAIGSAPRAVNFDKRFLAFMGSGPSPVATEGKTFYVMDALTGDVLYAPTVTDNTGSCTGPGDAVPCPPQNALFASASAYVPEQLVPDFVGNPISSNVRRVYLGDVHGQLWRWIVGNPTDGIRRFKNFTVDQPINEAVGLLHLANKPHVFVETGNDNRLNVPPNFQLWGLRDDDSEIAPVSDAAVTVFTRNFEGAFAAFRGTAQPATAFNTADQGRVFYIGTKFIPTGANCLSQFDSVLFALGAQSGLAAYDLTDTAADEALLIRGQRINAVRGSMGQLVLDQTQFSSSATTPPPPPPSGAAGGPLGGSGEVAVSKWKHNTPVCRQ